MAKESVEMGAAANGQSASPKRTRKPSEGPRKVKPVHLAVSVADKDGNPIEGAVITVHRASKDFETIYGHMEQNPGLSRVRVPLDNVD